jgi:hypothetical protein
VSARIGDRIELIHMPNDPDPIPAGTQGVVTDINFRSDTDQTAKLRDQISVEWDNGRSLMLIQGVDRYRVIE